MKKARLSVYLDPPLLDALSTYAARRNQSLSLIAEAAISAFVSPEDQERSVMRRLNRIDRNLERLERDTNISIETQMLFVWVWMTSNPPLPDTAAAATRASATARYDAFMESLGQRLAKGEPPSSRLAATDLTQ